MCRLGWGYNWAKLYFYWPYMIVSMVWNTSEYLRQTSDVPQPFLLLIDANLALAGCLGWNGAYGLYRLGWRYNGAKLYFSWSYMIVSMIWNSPKMFASNRSRATVLFVVDCCQFDLFWMFGLKMDFTACAGFFGGTTEQIYIFSWPYMIV